MWIRNEECEPPYTTCGGGAILAQGLGAVVNITSTWVNGNSASYGGGILLYANATLLVHDSTISGNVAVSCQYFCRDDDVLDCNTPDSDNIVSSLLVCLVATMLFTHDSHVSNGYLNVLSAVVIRCNRLYVDMHGLWCRL